MLSMLLNGIVGEVFLPDNRPILEYDASRFDYYAIIIILLLASQFRNLFSSKERKSCG